MQPIAFLSRNFLDRNRTRVESIPPEKAVMVPGLFWNQDFSFMMCCSSIFLLPKAEDKLVNY